MVDLQALRPAAAYRSERALAGTLVGGSRPPASDRQARAKLDHRFVFIGATVLVFAATAIALAWIVGVPFVAPTEDVSRAIGVHYIVPFAIGVAGYMGLQVATQVLRTSRIPLRERMGHVFADAYFLTLFVVVIYLHFHIKMWMPIINPRLYDAAYFASDQQIRALIDALAAVRGAVAMVVPAIDGWYQGGFLAMFALSLWFHAAGSRRWHYPNMTALLLLEMLGALSYLIAPAVGPFIFESGPNALATSAQDGMYASFREVRRLGAAWLSEFGGGYFTGPPAAMPSLHVAGAWIMTYYAFRARSVVAPVMGLLLAWIVVESVVSRWHYVVDLPAGLVLAFVAIAISNRVCQSRPI